MYTMRRVIICTLWGCVRRKVVNTDVKPGLMHGMPIIKDSFSTIIAV
jgi:hypothetical protein